jgi:hypothetical protein
MLINCVTGQLVMAFVSVLDIAVSFTCRLRADKTVLIDVLTTGTTGSGKDSLALGNAAGLERLAPFPSLGELIGIEGVIKRLVPYGPRP